MTKVGVDVYNQMTSVYSVNSGSRRWHVHVFYNVVDMALINSWIIYKHVCKRNIRRRKYIQIVTKELNGRFPTVYRIRSAEEAFSSIITNATTAVKERLTCTTLR